MASLDDVRAQLRLTVRGNHEQYDLLWRIIESLEAKTHLQKVPGSWLSPIADEDVPTVVSAMDWLRAREAGHSSAVKETLEIFSLSSLRDEVGLIRLNLPGFIHIRPYLRHHFRVPLHSPVQVVWEEQLQDLLLPVFQHYAASFDGFFRKPFVDNMLMSLGIVLLYPLTYCVAGRVEEADRLIEVLKLWSNGWIPLGIYSDTWYVHAGGDRQKIIVPFPHQQ